MSLGSERISSSLKRAVAERAKYYCEYCRSPEDYCPDSFTIDHIKPRQINGATSLDNLAWSCFGCNGRKHTKISAIDPDTQQNVALFNPRKQIWQEHFFWSDDYLQINGKTSCGRATISALSLNRNGVMNLRHLLINAGLHPPKEN